MVNVQKKDGTIELWSFNKIVSAVRKSAKRVDKELSKEEIEVLKNCVEEIVGNRTELSVLDIHNIVEVSLQKILPDVAESYRNYRNYRKDIVDTFDDIFQKTKNTLYNGDKENANFNSALISTKCSLVRGYLTKEFYKKFFLSKEELQAIEDGFIYIHDLRDLLFNGFNCCLLDIEYMLKNRFEMACIQYKKPKTFKTACDVIADIILVASAQQYGGLTVPEIDKILVPYVLYSYDKYYEKNLVRGMHEEDAHHYAWEDTLEEIKQGMQGIEMTLNTVTSSRGDTAFVTMTFGCVDGSVDKNIQREICKAILTTRMNGQGNGTPVVFPKLVYLHSEEQHKHPDQDALFDLAIECTSKAMYPDFLSLDNSEVGEIFKRTGKVVSPMGCRAFLSPYVDENGEEYYVGRANIGAVSLNLPMIWQKSKGKTFYQDLDKYLEMIRQFHIKRYDAIANNQCSTNPLCFTQGGIRGGLKKPHEKIGYDIVKSFTASFGITALNELNVLVEGKPLHESDGNKVKSIINYIDDKVKSFKDEDGYLYALYGTPAESLVGTQLQQFRKMFGIIKGVSDKEYFSNSFHCHVSADITPFEKQDKEHHLFHKINGGHIQYVRLDNRKNLQATRAIVKRGMKMGFYQGVNFDLVICEDCGDTPLEYTDTCSKCGSGNMTAIARTCGYLGYRISRGETRFNESKLAEVKDRISM